MLNKQARKDIKQAFKDYYQFKPVIDNLCKTCDILEDKYDDFRQRCLKDDEEIQQILGKALKFSWYMDDQKTFPNATEENGVFTGMYIGVDCADLAAKRIQELEKEVERLKEYEFMYKDLTK